MNPEQSNPNKQSLAGATNDQRSNRPLERLVSWRQRKMKMWDNRYRRLTKGEIIQTGDEVDNCNDGWRDEPQWEPAQRIGERAPDPSYPSHRIYRRLIKEEIDAS